LPYFQAISETVAPLDIGHRTFRCAEDLDYWIARIPKRSAAFVYVACHGGDSGLEPVRRAFIPRARIVEAFGRAKQDAISFLHFGTCGMVAEGDRRTSLREIRRACGARLISGYAGDVTWLPSTLLDIVIAAELFVPYHSDRKEGAPRLATRTRGVFRQYEALARKLGFSALVADTAGVERMIPERLWSVR
jgi:hypothetical protein